MTDEDASEVNEYDPDYEDEVCNKEVVLKVGSVLIPSFFTVVVLLSCIGNFLVLVILVLYKKFSNFTNVLILNLALSDLLFTFGLPFWASYYIWGWTFGHTGCKVVKFLFYAGFYSSVLFLTLMTVQRYMAVVHPLSDWEKCRGFSIAPIIIVWILSGTAALLGSHRSKVIQESPTNFYCEYDSIQMKLYIVYLQNAIFFIAILIMGSCYLRMQMMMKPQSKRKHRTARLLFYISLVFFIGWAPYNIVMFLRSLTDLGFYPFTECNVSINLEYAFYACRLLAFSHCCMNPAFYIFINVQFQNHSRKILKKICQK